jgi:hypothetical protein
VEMTTIEARELCSVRLNEPDARELTGRLRGVATTSTSAEIEIGDNAHPLRAERLELLRQAAGVPSDGRLFERVILLRWALEALPKVDALPVPDAVKALICSEASFVATASDQEFARYGIGSSRFTASAQTLRLQRFPAGQFDWEVGGISRSDLIRVSLARLPGVLFFVAVRMRGIRPVFFSHLCPRRPQRSLNEAEALRSYHRMASAMRRQPDIRGFAACSWFRSPSTHAVSPHLAWMNRVFLENGGLVVDAGPDDPDGGVLARSQTRKRLHQEGKFTPRRGLALWPRAAMLAWAEEHPEFAD